MKTTLLAAVIGATFLLPVHTSAQAAANNAEIRECVRIIAEQERTSARKTSGDERRTLITALGKIKLACINGQTEQAYRDAAKLQRAPQQAEAN